VEPGSAARAPDLALYNPQDRIQFNPVPIARLDRVPLAGPVLEASPPLGQVRAVLGVAGAVTGLDHPEALVGQ
jgi:hypothetical protein